MAGSPASRCPRPKNVNIDGASLFVAWEPWAKIKDPGFEWDGSDYAKACRSLAPDSGGLVLYMEPLKVLLKLAPTGFPTHASLRQVFEKLHNKYRILGQITPKQEWPAIADATDKWRVMCKDIYELKKKTAPPPELKPLTDLIELPTGAASAEGVATAATADKSAPETAASEGNASAASASTTVQGWPDFTALDCEEPTMCDTCEIVDPDAVTIINEICKCPQCSVPVPSPLPSGQKKETRAADAERRPRMPLRGTAGKANTGGAVRKHKLKVKTAAAKASKKASRAPVAPKKKHAAAPSMKKSKKHAKSDTRGKVKKGKSARVIKQRPARKNNSSREVSEATKLDTKKERESKPREEHTILTPVTLSFKKDGSGHLVECKVLGINQPKGSTYILGCSKNSDIERRSIMQMLLTMINGGEIKTIGEAKQEYKRLLEAD